MGSIGNRNGARGLDNINAAGNVGAVGGLNFEMCAIDNGSTVLYEVEAYKEVSGSVRNNKDGVRDKKVAKL